MIWNDRPRRVKVLCKLLFVRIAPYIVFEYFWFESQWEEGGLSSPKAKYNVDTDSKQVPWGKDEKDFEKRVQKYVKLLGGNRSRWNDWGLSVRALYHWLVICLFSVVGKSRIRSEGVFLFGSFLSCFSFQRWPSFVSSHPLLISEFNQSLLSQYHSSPI